MLSIEINDGQPCSLYAKRDGIPESEFTWEVRLRDFEITETVINDDGLVDMVLKFIDSGYERFTIHLEDCILVSPPQVPDDLTKVVCFDCLTGTVAHAAWTTEQVRAVVALALGGDEQPNAQALYEIAEPAIEGWPRECRPIP